MIEFVLVMAIIAVISAISTPYLLGSKEKILLQTEQEKILSDLKNAQQQSIAAYRGYEYSVIFNPPDQYRLQPENEAKTIHPDVEILSISPVSTISFEKLSGKPSSPLTLTLASTRFSCDIAVNDQGLISATTLEVR